MQKCCFMFGHATTPLSALPVIEAVAEQHYQEHGIRSFLIGNRGQFDQIAATAIKHLKQRHSDITLTLLLAYHPAERPVELSAGFDNSYYPPLERIPRRYAIVKANQYAAQFADSVICYVAHGGNARTLLEFIQQKSQIPVDNIAVWQA